MSLLRLTPFEELMYFQGGDETPCEIVIRCHFDRHLERSRFERAVEQAVRLHRLFASPIVQRGKRFYWDLGQFQPPTVEWAKFKGQKHLEFCRILDLAVNGCKIFVYEKSQGGVVDFHFHHCCSDGIGFCQFVKQLFEDYERNGSVEIEARERSALKQLRKRNRFGLSWLEGLRVIPIQIRGLIGVRKFMMRRPVRLLPEPLAHRPGHPQSIPDSLHRDLSREATQDYLAKAKRLGCTVNHLLMRDAFRLLRDFRSRQNVDLEQQEWLRMMIPINMRTDRNCIESAANMVTSIFLDQKGETLRNNEKLLQSIVTQMNRIRRNHFGLTFLFSLAVFQWIPGCLQRQSMETSRKPTAVLSNLGRIFESNQLATESDRKIKCGDAQLESIEFGLPMEGNTSVALIVSTYAGKMGITLAFDAAVLSPSQANELFDLMILKMRNESE